MEDIFFKFKNLFVQRCNHIALLNLGEDSVRYDFFTALKTELDLENYEIKLESPINSQCYIPRANIKAYRKEKPKMDLVVDKLKMCFEFGLFRQNSNEEGTINKTDRLIKLLNDIIRLGLESFYTQQKAYFVCVADSKMIGHQLRTRILNPFPSNYAITPNLIANLCELKTAKFDLRFVEKMNRLNLNLKARIVFEEEITANKINLETRIIIWEDICQN